MSCRGTFPSMRATPAAAATTCKPIGAATTSRRPRSRRSATSPRAAAARSATTAAESVLQRAGLRRDDAVHQPDVVALRVEPAVSGVRQHPDDRAQRRQDDLRLTAVHREQALGQRHHAQHQLHLGAALDRRRRQYRHRHRQRVRGRCQPAEERRPLLLAAQASRDGVRRVGAALVARPEERARLPARRLVDRADVRLPDRPAVGHAGQRRHRARRGSEGHCAQRQEGRAVHLRRQAVRGQLQHHDRQVRPAVGTPWPTAARSRTS